MSITGIYKIHQRKGSILKVAKSSDELLLANSRYNLIYDWKNNTAMLKGFVVAP